MIHTDTIKGLPACLSDLMTQPRWVGWKWVERDGKLTKPPLRAGGGYAHNDKRETWATYSEVKAGADRHGFAGVGLQLLNLPGFAALDLDKVRDKETGAILYPWAADLIACGSYAEVTPSGTGFRVLGRIPADFPPHHRKYQHPEGGEVEVYANTTTGRYITVTGNRVADAPDTLEDVAPIIKAVLDSVAQPSLSERAAAKAPPSRDWTTGGSRDRSGAFQSAVNRMRNAGLTLAQAESALRADPDGTGAVKYLEPRDRLATELMRSWDKAGDRERIRGLSFRHEDLDLIRDDKDRPIWNMANAVTLLNDHGDWHEVLAFDEFTTRRVLLRAIPGQGGGTYPRPLEDDDYAAAQAWFNRNGFPRATAEIVVSAVRKVCRHRSYDPLKDYLRGLEWDRVPRLASWLTTYCGAEASAYTSEVGLRWCISAVARGFKPGCKADHMLVLEGAQGRRKSSALAALAGEDWFSDALPQMGTKDAQSYLRGRWIIEVGELEAMRKEVDAIKAFITRQVEVYRPAYGREEVSEPRRCIFAGTTNKDDWQRDETGGRRFWPVKVGEIDVSAIERDRDQLWAEAVSLFRSGERWWLEGEIAEQAQAEAAERRPDDPWRADITRAVQGRTEVTTKEVLGEMGVLPSEMTVQLSKRVAQELVAIGWERAGRVTSGASKGAYRYTPVKVGEGRVKE